MSDKSSTANEEGMYAGRKEIDDFLQNSYKKANIEHEKEVWERIDDYSKALARFLSEKGDEDLTLDDFIRIEELLRTYKDFEPIEKTMAESGLDTYFDAENRRASEKRRKKIRRFTTDENAFDVGIATGIFGVVASLIQAIRYLKSTYTYVPLWKRGKRDAQRSYKFSRNAYSGFMKYLKDYTQLHDFGLVFGVATPTNIDIKTVLPLERFIQGAGALGEYAESLYLRQLLQKIQTDVRSDSCNETCPIELQNLLRLVFDRMKTDMLMEKMPIEDLGKSYLDKNSANWRFLGAYYYSKDLLKHDLEIDKVIENFKDPAQEKMYKFRERFDRYWDNVRRGLNMTHPAPTPKFLFFDRKTQFKKVDNIMKGLVPFFRDKGKKDLPILVCIDNTNIGTKRCMCIGYRTSENIYKRLRYYTPAFSLRRKKRRKKKS